MVNGLADGHARVEAGALEDDADALAQLSAAPAGVLAQHGHGPGAALAVALEDLDGGRLARAVRTEQAEDLAALDRKRDAAQRFDLVVALAQPVYLDRVLAHRA